jgi:hypothetical protein
LCWRNAEALICRLWCMDALMNGSEKRARHLQNSLKHGCQGG